MYMIKLLRNYKINLVKKTSVKYIKLRSIFVLLNSEIINA